MKKLLLLLLLPLFMKGQSTLTYKPNSEIINAEASIIVPLGNLSNKFDYAQSYGFWFKVGEDNGFAANIGFDVFLLKNARPINYKFNDSIYTINSKKFGFDIGIKTLKIIPISRNQKNYLELGATFAFDYLSYDFPAEETNDKEENNKYEPFKNTTVLLASEIKYIHENVGIKFQYRFTPYNIDGFESNFGSSSISFGIIYKQ